MIKYVIIVSTIILLFFPNTEATVQLSGAIEKSVIPSSSDPYIVENDIIIPDGAVLTIQKGCHFLCKPFTGIKVRGKLIIEGTASEPVVFTSINDNHLANESTVLPNPFDWNGILIDQSAAGVIMKNFVLKYSVYGVKSQTDKLEIENGLFTQNGQFHCTINDKILNVVDNVPFSLKAPISMIQDSISVKEKTKRKLNYKRIIFCSGLGTGVAGITVGTICLAKDLNSQSIVERFEKAQKAGIDPPPDATLEKAKTAYNNYPMQRAGAIIGYVAGGIGLAGLTLTFFF